MQFGTVCVWAQKKPPLRAVGDLRIINSLFAAVEQEENRSAETTQSDGRWLGADVDRQAIEATRSYNDDNRTSSCSSRLRPAESTNT